MHPQAEALAAQFIANFWSANHEIQWRALEQEKLKWLNSNTALVGKIDAQGITAAGKPFFGDWKTASKSKARGIKFEKIRWKMRPQSLTYGVLMADTCRDFTVRWAFKTDPITTDFEWYTYSQPEIDWWRNELIAIADDIRNLRRGLRLLHTDGWPTNLNYCDRYGEEYRCPFRDSGCWKLNFNFNPPTMHPRTESHIKIENDLKIQLGGEVILSELVVLDASRVDDWINCHERYRRLWEGDGLTEDSEALTIGHDFHSIIETHLNQIKEKQHV
jgi:hypothetical protein